VNIIEEARVFGAEFRVDTQGKVLVRNFSRLPEHVQSHLRQYANEVREQLKVEKNPIVLKSVNNLKCRANLLSQLVITEAELILLTKQLTTVNNDPELKGRIASLERKVNRIRKHFRKLEKEGC